MSPLFWKRSIWFFRLALGSFIIWYLADSGHLPLNKLSPISIKSVVILISISFIMVLLIAARLSLLFFIQQITLPIQRSYNYCCLGLLTALFIPSALSADISKGLLLARENREHKITVLFTIIFDRVIGTLALGLIACLFSVFFLTVGHVPDDPTFLKKLTLLIGVAFGFTVLGFMLCLTSCSKRFWEWKIFSKLFHKVEVSLRAEDFTSIMERFGGNRKVLTGALGLSLLNHLFRALAFYIISREAGINIDFFQVGFIISLASFINIVPISPGNFGAGDAAFGFLFSYLEQSSGAAVSLVARVVFYLPAFYGAVVILLSNQVSQRKSQTK